MAVISITSGAHWRNTVIDPHTNWGDDQFAHVFDCEEPEGVPQQAINFIRYSTALGGSQTPHVLIAPESEGFDPEDWAHVQVEMADWRQIVESATGVQVVIA